MTSDPRPAKVEEYLTFLRDQRTPPSPVLDLMWTPARDMTKEQARDFVIWLLACNRLQIPNHYTLFSIDSSGSVVPPPPQTRITISPAKIFGVTFRYLLTVSLKSHTTSNQVFGNLDFRNVVFLYRLCVKLRLYYGVDTIFHIGFMFAKERNDCHGQGRACDFGGASGDGFDLTIAEHWSAQPITMPKDWTDPATRKAYKKGDVLPNWPKGFTDTYYRLDATQNPNLKSILMPGIAGPLFKDVYDLAARECKDRDIDNNDPTTIGSGSHFIIHPDYPQNNSPGQKDGREEHWQHIHMQIGKKGAE